MKDDKELLAFVELESVAAVVVAINIELSSVAVVFASTMPFVAEFVRVFGNIHIEESYPSWRVLLLQFLPKLLFRMP